MRTLWYAFNTLMDFLSGMLAILIIVLLIAGKLKLSCGTSVTGSVYTCTFILEKFWN